MSKTLRYTVKLFGSAATYTISPIEQFILYPDNKLELIGRSYGYLYTVAIIENVIHAEFVS